MEAISLNANGLRAALRKGLDAWLEVEHPDLVFLQEVKWNDEGAVRAAFPGWHSYSSLATKPGYSGVLTLSRVALEPTTAPELPSGLVAEGRYLALRRDEIARWEATGNEWSVEDVTAWELNEYLPFY